MCYTSFIRCNEISQCTTAFLIRTEAGKQHEYTMQQGQVETGGALC